MRMAAMGRDPITASASKAINMSLTVGNSHFGNCALE